MPSTARIRHGTASLADENKRNTRGQPPHLAGRNVCTTRHARRVARFGGASTPTPDSSTAIENKNNRPGQPAGMLQARLSYTITSETGSFIHAITIAVTITSVSVS